jgi:hypothetical protein
MEKPASPTPPGEIRYETANDENLDDDGIESAELRHWFQGASNLEGVQYEKIGDGADAMHRGEHVAAFDVVTRVLIRHGIVKRKRHAHLLQVFVLLAILLLGGIAVWWW